MGSLSSMTGYGAASGDAGWGAWSVEARSVNGRSLDVRVNTPPGFDVLERQAKAAAAERFSRGSLQVAIRIDLSGVPADLSLNEALLDRLVALVQSRSGTAQAPDAGVIAQLLSQKGVIETETFDLRSLARDAQVMSQLEAGIGTALDGLKESRLAEGAAQLELLQRLLDEFRQAAAVAAEAAGTQPELLRTRLEDQLSRLGADDAVERDRLAAEVALSVAKADVREELDRLSAHFASAGKLLEAGSPVGRKLDFLSQEIGREANTLCSKSASLELTNAGLELKALNDQLKEQVANVE